MSLIPGWLPPSRENWELLNYAWQFFPLFTAIQWITDFFPQGKTSISSRFNIPGKYAWAIMESPGVLLVWYLASTLPEQLNMRELPIGNKTMIGMYTIHYIYRAWVSPLLLNPSMSPIHPIVFFAAGGWQAVNGLVLGGWMAGYGPSTVQDWAGRAPWILCGMVVWGWGLLGNMFHDDELREIRRTAIRERKNAKQTANGKESNQKVASKHYSIPQNGLFEYILFPHYLCEWIEWCGFWMVGGLDCIPARSFVVNEVSTMFPRALAGRRWYIERFGKDKIGSKKAVIPGII